MEKSLCELERENEMLKNEIMAWRRRALSEIMAAGFPLTPGRGGHSNNDLVSGFEGVRARLR